jgi:hypothetical protein
MTRSRCSRSCAKIVEETITLYRKDNKPLPPPTSGPRRNPASGRAPAHVDKRPPYKEQESEELPDEIIARLNPNSGEVENLEVLFFSTQLLRSDPFELPVSADLRLVGAGRT